MGAKYLPTIKDQKAIQRFKQNQKQKLSAPPTKKSAPASTEAPPKDK
ncbi:MAG: hypothetical protein ABIZ04_11980 [Opitutus sp.]